MHGVCNMRWSDVPTGRALLFNDGLLLAERSKKGLKVLRWLAHDEYALRDSATPNSVEVHYAGGTADAWLCDSETDKRALLTLAQQLCAGPADAAKAPAARAKGRDATGSRSLSLRNVRMLLEKAAPGTAPPATIPIPASAASATTTTAAAAAAGGAGTMSRTLRSEAESAELSAMRLKLLEWRSLVDTQGVDLANERKMRIALEQRVLQLTEEVRMHTQPHTHTPRSPPPPPRS